MKYLNIIHTWIDSKLKQLFTLPNFHISLIKT
jgi:hypothetical protein